jgi:hypothetical protein
MLWRLHFGGGDHPSAWNEFRRFGPLATARFDHHTMPRREQNRAILYAATKGPVCIAEAFQRDRTIDRTARNPLLVGFRLRTDVPLLDLTGLWPTKAGASTLISSSEARSRTQHWSRSMWRAYPDVVGLLYASSMHGSDPAVALYERGESSLPESPLWHLPLSDPALSLPLRNLANRLGYDLV